MEEVRGARSKVIGVREQLEDAKLQQFVSSKTKTPVSFSHHVHVHEGKSVDIITVSRIQQRPVSLLRDFGKLKRDVVYLRRGSSTDQASPEEVARMVKADAALEREIPFLSIALGDAFSQTIMENPAILESVIVVEASPKEDLEMLKKWRNVLPLIDASKHFKPTLKLQLKDALSDPDYESKIRTYHTFRALVSRVHLHVRNHSEITAHDVRIEITIPHSPGLIILDEHPESPVERLGLASIAARVGIHRVPSDIFLKKMESGYHIEVLAGKIQAGAAYWTDDFLYIGSSVAQVISPFVRIYSDELRQPMTQGLPIRIQIKKRVYDKSEWEAIDKLDEQ